METNVVPSESCVLIVEDEALIAEELRDRLARIGFSVTVAVDSAADAVAAAMQQRPALVLLDIKLRGENDGVYVAREIRRYLDVPIIYLTAYSDALTVDRAKASEHDGFILKPFHRRELQSTIEVAMQRYDRRLKERNPSEHHRE
jgi:DNA-binding response OmpR family regulator